jgi:hypothetical protein
LRFRRAPEVSRALLLGLVLALGYYAKAPFFPMGLVFILCACIGKPVSRRTIFLGGTALATYLLACAPYIAAISFAKGHFTFGESSRLAEASTSIEFSITNIGKGGPWVPVCQTTPLAS